MPYSLRKTRNKNCYSIKSLSKTNKKKIFSKCSSLKNAKRQLRLLNALHYNKNFIPYSYNRNKTRKLRK